MPTPVEARQRARTTYNAAADTYDAGALSFWSYFGNNTVRRLQLCPGNQVLDVACGSGASALPAAEVVGPTGKVIGVDLSSNLLELARTKASERRLNNIQFEVADMMDLNFPSGNFDVVVCVFGIFFVPDMSAAANELWRMVRPGGQLAITTWGGNLFEPANSAFWNSIREVRPDLEKAFNPWDRVSEPGGLSEMLKAAGVQSVDVALETRLHPIDGPDDWWKIVCGSGYRGTLEQLSSEEFAVVHEANLNYIREHRITALQTNALYARAQKDSSNS